MANKNVLVIVESPNKCASIKKYLSDIKDHSFTVMASVGHIRDLKKDASGIEIKNGFKPNFIDSSDKKDIIKGLKEAYKKSDECIIMTDGDNEGSAIGFHICEVLGIDPTKVKRAITLEITKKAVTEAVMNPGKLDMNVVDAAISRRILDRIFGFTLSPLLWNKIQMGLSAGRVQSPGLRLICEKFSENKKFSSEPDFKIIGDFEIKDKNNKIHTFKSTLDTKFKTKQEAENFLKNCIGKQFVVKSIEKKPGKKSPSPPFATSSLQMECSRKFGMSPKKSMEIAQELFSSGKISYHRSDSVTLSEDALNSTEQQITEQFGKKYSNKKQYTNKKDSSTGGAHECIRPTDFTIKTIDGTSDLKKVYDLIYKRTLSSQMADAKFDNTIVTIEIKGVKELFISRGAVQTFDGFLALYSESLEEKESEDDESENKSLPNMTLNQNLIMSQIMAGQVFTKPPSLYTEASLIKKLEDLQIGRPSTFASILSVIQTRNYCEKKDIPAKKRDIITLTLKSNTIDEQIRSENFGKETGKLIPTDIGIIVNEYLCNNFSDLIGYDFTKKMEKQLDEISEGKIKGQKMLEEFYVPFMESISKAKGSSDRPGGRELGIDPTSGLPVTARLAKFGPVIQLGVAVKQEKGAEKVKSDIKFAKIPEDKSIDTITLEEALDLLKWPRTIGEHKKLPVEVNEGKFGPYVKWNSKFFSISIPKETITIEEAIEIIKLKESGGGGGGALKEFGDLRVMNGKFGHYINNTKTKKNFKIPDHYDIDKLTKSQCEEIIGESKDKKPYKKFTKKKK